MNDKDPWASGAIDAAAENAILRAVGDLLRRARQASGLKLATLAELCDVSQSVLCRIELGRRRPATQLLLTVCSRLGIRLSDVFRAAEDAAVPLPASPRDGRFHELLGQEDRRTNACVAAADRYRHTLGWESVKVGDGRPTVALSMPQNHAAVDVDARHAELVDQRLADIGLVGPVIGWPDGRSVFLVRCTHESAEAPEPGLDPVVAHLGIAHLVYLPPSRCPTPTDAPLTWLHEPTPDMVLPNCEQVFAAIRNVIW